jgi:type I restriction enzyme, S subunit
MSFPRYPVYKDSGVEWLGEVPAHWFVGRVKHVCNFFTGWTPPTGNSASYIGDNLWANISDLGPKRLLDTAKTISDEAVRGSDIQVSKEGNLLFSFKLSIGQVSFAGRDLYTNEAIATFPPSERLWLPFAYYALPLFLVKNASENIYGAKLLNQELMRAAPVVLPGTEEQKNIATFLDHETTKIDALVAEQERLIELLKEKRQAVISHAVTKGLDPFVPMKDSGVEWLGEVPAHWEVRQVRSIVSFLTSGPRGWSERVGEEGSLFVQSGDLTDDLGIAFTQAKRVAVENDAEAARTRLLVGDVVVCITGAKTGNVAVCAAVEEDAYINQHLCLIRPTADVLPWFLGVFLKSDAGQRYFGIAQYGLKQGLSLENVKATPLLVPPVSEQEALVAAVTHASEQMDQLIGEAVLSIELLRERRTALISAAVTGQIDVRGWVPAETAH